MTTPESQRQDAANPPPPATPGPDGDPGDQDIDAAGTDANPLPVGAASNSPLAAFLLSELDREVDRTRRALQQVPADRAQWKPHDRSMVFGDLSHMVATIPSWIAMIVNKDDVDIAPTDGSTMRQEVAPTSTALLQGLDAASADARTALRGTTDGHLHTGWRLKAGGNVVQEAPRVQMIQDTFNHWAHHRGQMTVYLRMMDAHVPAIYGPSADETSFR
jgi:uncharacterized damage-inducible protein DinB